MMWPVVDVSKAGRRGRRWWRWRHQSRGEGSAREGSPATEQRPRTVGGWFLRL